MNQNLSKIPRNVWILGLGSLLTDISSEMIHSLLPLFLVSVLGASVLTVGLIEGVAEATASLLKVFSGTLSDYLGHRKQLVVLGYGLSTLVKPLFALTTSPTGVLIARFGDRFGKGIRVAPRNALVADSTNPENRGAAYGLRQSLDTIGAFLGPIIAFSLMAASQQNFRLVFWLALIPGILAVIVLAGGLREAKVNTANKNYTSFRWQLNSLNSEYWILVVVALIFNLGNSSNAFLLLRASQIGISAPLVPLTVVVMNIAYSFSAYPVGILSDRLGRFKLLVGGFVLYALVYIGFAFAQTPWQIWGLFAFYGLYLGMTQGIMLALISDKVPPQLRGTAFGFLNLVVGFALLPASLLAGSLWELGSSQATFITGSLFAILATLLLIAHRNKYENSHGDW
ncbi:major facilitator superfamily MFS_1 (plasmid) [Gloeocapsa sp. PCC 7428]|uniref:MFS transporter n=1 Tax=Gloeocapsa sp. PCC 7428 TaxID=1173026 RepID=UPI0002A5D855|nr:MFS transporter [Gloeocapsa sp. PCC 7428]AFZ33329.1 major facilitator superfamily MFS_1 [Gloeocapsa sp. PCC 7428]